MRPRPLGDLIDGALAELLLRAPDLGDAGEVAATGVAQAHDRVVPGGVFVARRGARVDGHDFAADAVAAGARAIVGERAATGPRLAGVPYVAVRDAKAATARLAAALYDHPSRRLAVVGVTGTDGKTTTCTLLHRILDDEAGGAGLISTARIASGADTLGLEGRFTTPEAPEVQALLARFIADGRRFAVLESSSHGLAQGRLDAIDYDVAVVTTFSAEHLDFHGSLEAYLAAKQQLLRRAPIAVLNRDLDAYEAFAEAVGLDVVGTDGVGSDGSRWDSSGSDGAGPDATRGHEATPGGAVATRILSYGRARSADYRTAAIETDAGSVRFALRVPGSDVPIRVEVPMPGSFNALNASAALAAADALGVSVEVGAARLARLEGVPGRMQPVQRTPFAVIVDFAHTAEALETALATLRTDGGGRTIVVVGAAGERDPGKRGPIGSVAVRRADFAIFTEEDSRSESVDAIVEAMAAGARAAGGREGRDFEAIPDRRAAIRRAVALARDGDVVLLAGKGHEATLERADETLAWDEASEARAALADRGRGRGRDDGDP